MSSLVITIKTARADVADFAQDSSCDIEGLQGLRNLLDAAVGSHEPLVADLQYSTTDPVAASATLTLASVPADDTAVIAGVTLTAKASPDPEEPSEWSQAGSDTVDAASLAACINAHTTLNKLVRATSAAGVVTVTCLVKGLIGNHLTITEGGDSITATGSGLLTGGTGGATSVAKTYSSL